MWINNPQWQVMSMYALSPGIVGVPSLTFTGNGRPLTRVGMIFRFWDGAFPGVPLANGYDIKIGKFNSVADFLNTDFHDGNALPYLVDEPSNSNWLTPIATIEGQNYYYIEANISQFNLSTTAGSTQVIAMSLDLDSAGPAPAPFAQTTSGDGPALDYYSRFTANTSFAGDVETWLASRLIYGSNRLAGKVFTTSPVIIKTPSFARNPIVMMPRDCIAPGDC